jgi:hypothetical protein
VPRRSKRRTHRRTLLTVAGAVALVALGIHAGQRASEWTSVGGRAAAHAQARSRETPGSSAGRIALVIDDLGRSVAEVERLLALGVPLGYAVLPWERRTREVAARLARAEAELLCHLPMAGRAGANPGPGALSPGDRPARLAALTRRALDELPEAAGVNNHMGSRLTADPEAMAAVLDAVAARGLYFLDSRTTPDSVAFDLARARDLPAARRDLFLDEDPGEGAIEEAFDRLLDLARARGAAVAIGHPRPATLAVLARRIPDALARGFEFVPPSDLLEREERLP